jgi:GNAT superfamily N-acetyltransferase
MSDAIVEKSGLRYVHLDVEHAEALERLELSVFDTIDPSDLYHSDELALLAATFPEGNFVVLDGDTPIDGVSNHSIDHDWYYGTDISVYPEYRGRGIGRQLYELRKGCVRDLNKKGIVAGGVIPGFRDHKASMSAEEYVAKVVAGEFYDPTTTFQIENGFEVLGVLSGYVDDESVDGHSTLIRWTNPDYRT